MCTASSDVSGVDNMKQKGSKITISCKAEESTSSPSEYANHIHHPNESPTITSAYMDVCRFRHHCSTGAYTPLHAEFRASFEPESFVHLPWIFLSVSRPSWRCTLGPAFVQASVPAAPPLGPYPDPPEALSARNSDTTSYRSQLQIPDDQHFRS